MPLLYRDVLDGAKRSAWPSEDEAEAIIIALDDAVLEASVKAKK